MRGTSDSDCALRTILFQFSNTSGSISYSSLNFAMSRKNITIAFPYKVKSGGKSCNGEFKLEVQFTLDLLETLTLANRL